VYFKFYTLFLTICQSRKLFGLVKDMVEGEDLPAACLPAEAGQAGISVARRRLFCFLKNHVG